MRASPASVGFVGLGKMGRPMAARLHAAGYPMVVNDAVAATASSFAETHRGAKAAAALVSLRACDTVVTMLPDSDAVDAVVLGADGVAGLVEILEPGTLVIDMSSSQPMRSRVLARALSDAGKRFLDAPVSGGVRRAVDGTLAVMVGGEAAVFESARGLLGHLGKALTHVGPAGAGHAMKALNNYVSAAGLVAVVEALHAGRRFGLDPSVMTDVFNGSTGRNNTTENKVKPFMLSGAFDSGFALALMAKDLGIAMSLGEAIDCPMRLGREVHAIWVAAARQLGAAADHTEMYRWLEPRGD